jgi:glycerol uptake facilitator-like aquaporin
MTSPAAGWDNLFATPSAPTLACHDESIWGCARRRAGAVPFAVGAYISAAYWFTSSTSFANPAVTLARAASDTFAGIRVMDVPCFVAQLLGAGAATATFRWLVPALPAVVDRLVDPREELR